MELIIASFIVLGLYMAAEALYERNWYKNVYTDIAFEKEYMKYGEPVTMIIEAGNNSRIYLPVHMKYGVTAECYITEKNGFRLRVNRKL